MVESVFKFGAAIGDGIIVYLLISHGEYSWAGAFLAFSLGLKGSK